MNIYFILTIFISIIVNILCLFILHKKIPVPIIIVIAAIISVSIFQIYDYLYLGYLDPFFLISSFIQFFMSSIIGTAIFFINKYFLVKNKLH